MPLFYFNSLTGDLFLPDPEGEELPNVDSAREVAEQSAREALIEALSGPGTRLPIAFRLPIARVARWRPSSSRICSTADDRGRSPTARRLRNRSRWPD